MTDTDHEPTIASPPIHPPASSPARSTTSEAPLPSVRSSPLIDSYTYHSVDPPPSSADSSSKGKEREWPLVAGEWMLGVDEAGRGPVLGDRKSVV